ncbi:MAG: sigma-70 family RNA polymerase sigma factor [Planctomycetota bacterium]
MTRFEPNLPPTELAALLRHGEPALVALARRVLAGRDGSEDAVQDAWLATLEDPAEAQVGGWPLARIVKRFAQSRKQREARRARHEHAVAAAASTTHRSESAASAAERADTRRVVLEELLALGVEHRDVLLLRFVEGRSVDEVAGLLDVPAATVRTRVHRALPRLRERLERRFGVGREGWVAALAPLALVGHPVIGAAAGQAAYVEGAAGAGLALWLARGLAVAALFVVARVGVQLALEPAALTEPERTLVLTPLAGPPSSSGASVAAHDAQTVRVAAPTVGEHERAAREVGLAPSGSLTVRVEDTLGAPLADATVRLQLDREGDTEAQTLTTDATGRLTIERVESFELLGVAAPDRVVVSASGGMDRTEGGFDDVVVVLAKAARLTVQTVDAASGAPLPGVVVRVRVADDEPRMCGDDGLLEGPDDRPVDTSGRATFDHVPSAQRLAVTLEFAGGRRLTALRTRGADLIACRSPRAAQDATGDRLVLHPGEDRVLRIALPTLPLLRLALTDESGAPLKDTGASLARILPSEPWASADAWEGSEWIAFSAEGATPGVVEFFGGDEDLSGQLYVEAWQHGARDIDRRAVFLLDAARCAASLATPIIVPLPRVAPIRGEFENPWGYTALAIAHDPVARLSTAVRDGHLAGGVGIDGRFTTDGLIPGAYDLLIAPCQPEALPQFWRYGPFDAGAEGVQIGSRTPAHGRLTIEVRGLADPDGASLRVLRATSGPRGLPQLGRGATRVIRDAAGPTPRDRHWCRHDGLELLTDGTLVTSQWRDVIGGRVEVPYLSPGPVYVLVEQEPNTLPLRVPRLREAASGWLEFTGGDARLVFELQPAARVTGRIPDLPLGADWGVAAVDGEGRPLNVLGPLGPATIVPLAATGRFAFEQAPVGPIELRFGPRADLAAGLWSRTLRATLAAGENGPLLVR